jgi:hypothetical protein
MKIIEISKSTKIAKNSATNNEIHVFTQFFIHSDKNRNKELIECLLENFNNPSIDKIHLLTERIYSYQEMGFVNIDNIQNKIIQTNIGKRLKFQHVFEYIRTNSLKGYMILVNSDIFFDSTISNLKLSCLHEEKTMFALLRYEYNRNNQAASSLFGPRFDSQDTWIFHSETIIKHNQEKAFNFEFGKPGCDNKLIYLLKIIGYEVINDPSFIKTYHNHSSQVRNYSNKDVIENPWGIVVPSGTNPITISQSLGINLKDILLDKKQDLWFEDNAILRNYIQMKMDNNTPFIVPRPAGIENNFAVFAKIYNSQNKQEIDRYFSQVVGAMHKNAGIKLSNYDSIQKYSKLYLEAFDNSELFFNWDIQGNVLNHITHSHEYLKQTYSNKKMIWALCLDIFHYIHSNPWTQALKGKRILIVSSFVESIKEQIPIRDKLYDGIELFPDCTFVYIKPPQTQGDNPSLEFDQELSTFYIELDKIKDDYDVALLSCGGYGNLISNYIFTNHEKSAIYVGGVLQMYFGILGNRWFLERPDIIRLYMNSYWKRPKDNEKPKGFEKVERGCYW